MVQNFKSNEKIKPSLPKTQNVTGKFPPLPPENKKRKNGGLLIVLLLLGLIGLGYFSFHLYKEKQRTAEELTKQKEQIIKELTALQTDYENVSNISEQTAKELQSAKKRIGQYLDSLKVMKADVASLWKYRKQVQILKQERTKLIAINDSLFKLNQKIAQERDSTASVLNDKMIELDSVAQKNHELKQTVKKASVFTLKSIVGEAVKERSGGKYVETERSRATDKIRICYTVGINHIAKEGNRFFYIQVISPLNVTLGKNELVTIEDKTVNYSTISEFIYEKQPVDVCEYITTKNKKYNPGTYQVRVFDEDLVEVAKSSFKLK